MATSRSFFVKTRARDLGTRFAIWWAAPGGQSVAGPEYVGVALGGVGDAPEQRLAALSARLHTDVIWLAFQSVVDAFEYHHWRDGALLRSLVYGFREAERTWERVEGTPEPWEAEILFGDPEDLRAALESAESATERADVERAWRERRPAVGSPYPMLDARDCGIRVHEHYDFPHFA